MTIENGPEGIFYNLTDSDDRGVILSNTSRFDPAVLATLSGGIRALGGNDEVAGSSRADLVYGNAGSDTLYGFGGNDTLWGGIGEDLILGDGLPNAPATDDDLNGNRGNDYVNGGPGNDLVRGGQDNDYLIGDAGNDTLIGDFGQDTLIGAENADVFVLRRDTATTPDASGTLLVDIIADFNPAEDFIGLTGGLKVSDLQLLAVSSGTTTATGINFVENGVFKGLGFVAGVSPEQLVGRFVDTSF